MRLSYAMSLLVVLAVVAAGCGGEKKAPQRTTTLDNLSVKGENLTKANRLYSEGNRLYMGGGVGVAEKQRKKNLKLAIKKYRAARGTYAKALKRHPDNLRLQNRVREVDMSIDGCKRMVNLNLTR
jgi:hypothetical protein